MKGRRLIPRPAQPQSCSIIRKKPVRVRRNEPKLAENRRTGTKRGGSRARKGGARTTAKRGTSGKKAEKTKQAGKRYSDTRKISFSQPKSQNYSRTKGKRGKGNASNLKTGRKLYKHSTKTAKKKSRQAVKGKQRNKFTLSVPKKKGIETAKLEEIRKKRKMASLNRKTQPTEKKIKSKKKPKQAEKKRTPKTEAKDTLQLNQMAKKASEQLKQNYRSENIYSPTPDAIAKMDQLRQSKNHKKMLGKGPNTSPSFSKEYIESIRKYNQSMEQFRSNLVRNQLHIRSEHFSQSSNKSNRIRLFLRNRAQRLSPFRLNQAHLLKSQIQKSYSNVLYEKRGDSGGKQPNTDKRNYNSLYSGTRLVLNQKRSKSSNLSQHVTADDVMLLNGFDPVRYLALKQEVRGKSLNSTAKTVNLKRDLHEVKSSGKEKAHEHSSLPPVSNVVIQKGPSKLGGIRMYKLGENLLRDPKARKLVEGKKIYSLGKHKYIRLDSLRKVEEGG